MNLRLITLAFLVLFILILAGSAYAFLNQNMLLAGKARAPTLAVNVTSVALSNTNFTTGTAGTVGTLSATLSSGSPTGTFSLANSGTDHAGTTCNNYSSDFSVSGSSLNFTSGAPAQSYPGTCITYTQAGVSNSPYTQAFALIGSSGGGNNPPVPAGATAASFTTLELNMDFTGATTSSYNGSSFNAQALGSWLNCSGTYSPTNPLFWTSGNPVPCNAFNIINDGGTNVLDLQYQATYGTSLGAGATAMDGTNTVNSSPPTPAFVTFPLGLYYEIKWRETTNTLNSCPLTSGVCLQVDAWAWFGPNGGSVEWDFVEMYSNGSAGPACHNSACSGPPGTGFPGIDSYHIYGIQITTDGTVQNACTYLDNSLVGCGGHTTVAAADATQRNYLRVDVGPQSTTGWSGQWPTQTMDAYIQYIRVWGCSGWFTNPCTGGVIN